MIDQTISWLQSTNKYIYIYIKIKAHGKKKRFAANKALISQSKQECVY